MRFSFQKLAADWDWWLAGSALALSVFGLVIIHGLTLESEPTFVKQLIFLGLGLAVFLAGQFFDHHFWRNAAVFFYGAALVLLLVVLVFSEPTRGVHSWFYLGPLAMQPAEFAKIAVIMFLAMLLERIHFDIANFRHLLLVLLIIALPAGLILLQPDFGSAFVLTVMSGVMVLYTGLDRQKFMALALAVLLLLVVGWFGLLRDYQKTRLLAFINPRADPLGAGYNVRQALVAIGSGGFWGRGLGAGPQSQLQFLPEQKTDFVFASLAEELGFVGAAAVLILYVLLLWRIYWRLRAGGDLFTNFLLLGIFTMLLTQTVVNIGMNMGLFPITGVTLPLLSYGGSSLLVTWFALGLAQNAPRY